MPRSTTSRRSSRVFSPAFLRAFADAPGPLTIDELLQAGGEACRYTHVVRWLAVSLVSGVVRETPVELDHDGRPRGQRRFELT